MYVHHSFEVILAWMNFQSGCCGEIFRNYEAEFLVICANERRPPVGSLFK
jgi:hypothetical protein